MEENEEDIVNEYENLDLIEQGNEDEPDLKNSLAFKEKIRRTGLIYISHIPLGMTVSNLKKLLSDYGVLRVYLIPLKEKKTEKGGKPVQSYKEGWVEFEDKILAKLAEYQLNGKVIGGKKSCPYKDEIWTIKYLHKFKWHNLMEKINFDKNLREKKLKTEMAQTKRENEFIMKNLERSKMLNKKIKRDKLQEGEQNSSNNNNNNDKSINNIQENNKEEPSHKEHTKEEDEEELNKIKKKFKQKKPIYKK